MMSSVPLGSTKIPYVSDEEVRNRLSQLGFALSPRVKIRRPKSGPPMLESLRGTGEPIRYYDLLMRGNIKLTPGEVWLPGDGPTKFSSESLHPPSSRLSLTEARQIRSAFWNGDETIGSLVAASGLSFSTVHSLLHGLTYWWI